MLSIFHATHIDVPPEKVWPVMADVERWPEFAPQFQSIVPRYEGALALGKSARVTPKGFAGATWTVTEYQEGRSFTWEANVLPGVHLLGGHVVEPDGGGSRVTLSLQASGPLWIAIGPLLGRIFRRNVRQEGEGMKAYCEGRAS